MDLEEIQRHLDTVMNEQNNRSIPEFEGYSPFEMHQILNFTFEKDSPLQLQKISDSGYENIPILNQIKYLANLIEANGEIRLTKKGFLPTKIVSDIYNQGYLKDEHIERGITKLYKETDSISINITRLLLELSGLSKKRKGKLSLTKKAKNILGDNYGLLRLLLLTFATKFNWPFYDGYGQNQIGQLGYGYSLILLSKYGGERRLNSFYAEKYFKAFPRLEDTVEPTYGTLKEYTANCYSLRTFERFLDFFGLIKMQKEGKRWNTTLYIKKSDFFDSLIKCKPHNSRY